MCCTLAFHSLWDEVLHSCASLVVSLAPKDVGDLYVLFLGKPCYVSIWHAFFLLLKAV